MRGIAGLLVALGVATNVASGEEVRLNYSLQRYNVEMGFSGTIHPGTLFTPAAEQYPVFVKRVHIYFGDGGLPVEVKVWSATGSVVGSVLASFPITTVMYPIWTDVDVSSAGVVIRRDNFFVSTNDRAAFDMKPVMVCDYPGVYGGHHFISADDLTWQLQTIYDFSIECTVETNYDIAVAPASLGRVRALYR